MAEEFEIARAVYKVEVVGMAQAEQQLNDFVAKIEQFTKDLAALKSGLKDATSTGDSSSVGNLTARIKELETEIEKLTSKESSARREIEALTKAENDNKKSTEDLKNANKFAGDSASEAGEKFKTLQQRISELNTLRQKTEQTGALFGTFENEELTLQQMVQREKELSVELNRIMQIRKDSKGVLDQENIAQESSLAKLRQQREELQIIVANISKSGTGSFQGQIQSQDQLIQKLKEVNQQIKDEEARINNATKAFNNQLSEYQQLILARKQLTDLVKSAELSGRGFIEFQGLTIPLEQAKQKVIEINQQVTNLNKLFDKPILEKQLSEFELFKADIKELTNLINSAKLSGANVIDFKGSIISITDAEDKVKGMNSLVKEFSESLKAITVQKQITELEKLKSDIKELTNLTQSAQIGGRNFVEFEGAVLSLDQAKIKVQELKILQNNLNSEVAVQKALTDAVNLAEEQSVTKLKQERIELEQILKNRQQGATTVTFNGTDIDINRAIDQRNQLKAAEDELTQKIKLRDLASKASEEGINGLTAKAKLLTESLKALNGNLTLEQFQQMQANLRGLVPGFDQFTQAEVNAGKATDLLTKETFEANKAILDFQRSISGRNTLVGDYTKGIVDAFKNSGLTSVLADQRNQIQGLLIDQAARIAQLRAQYEQLKGVGGDAFERIRQEMLDAGREQGRLQEQLKLLNNGFKETGTSGVNIANSISSGFESLGRRIVQTVGLYFGFQAAISGVTKAINVDKELTDKFADLQRVLETTKENVDGIVSSLRNIDTRTPISELTDMAIIAAKAGVAEKDIAGVTDQINKLKLVVGKDFNGDIETATENLVKLVNIFIGPGQATAENIGKISNALITLDQEGVATVDFITKFSEEMSGIQGITKIGIASVLGLGAAFQETGIRAEVSSTAISQILIRIGSDIQKYAALANNVRISDVTQSQVDAFRALLRDNPGEALIQLAVGLKSNKEAFDEFGSAFADLGAKGFKVTSVFGDLADKADFFRSKIILAKDALQNQNQIIDGAALKEENLAGTLDKIGAAFQKAFSNKDVMNALEAFARGLLNLTEAILSIPFNALIIGIGALSAGYLLFRTRIGEVVGIQRLMNQESVSARLINQALERGIISETAAEGLRNKVGATSVIQQTALRKAAEARIISDGLLAAKEEALAEVETLRNAAVVDTIALQKAEQAALEATALAEAGVTAATEASTAAIEGMNVATKASPWGIILSILSLLVISLGAFGSKLEDTNEILDDNSKKLDANAAYQNKLKQAVADSVTTQSERVKVLTGVLSDSNTTIETRKAAYNELIKISPNFVNTLDQEYLATSRLKQVTDDYINSLTAVAEAKAFQSLVQDATQGVVDVIKKQSEAEFAIKDFQTRLQDITLNSQKKFNELSLKEQEDFNRRAAQRNAEAAAFPNARMLSGADLFASEQQVALQGEINKKQDELTKLALERKSKEEFSTQVQLNVQQFIVSNEEKRKVAEAVIAQNEEGIDEIRRKAKQDQLERQRGLSALQKQAEDLQTQYNKAIADGDANLANQIQTRLDAVNSRINQSTTLTESEQELARREQIISDNKKSVTDINSKILASLGIEQDQNQQILDTTVKNVISIDATIEELKKERDGYNEQIVETIAQIESVDKNSSKYRELNSKLDNLVKARNDVLKKLKELGVKPGGASEGLSDQENSILKYFESQKQLQLAELEEWLAGIKAVRKATLEEETTYNQKVYEITKFWDELKIKAITGDNNAEKLERAKLHKEIADSELHSNQTILQLDQNFLNERRRIVGKALDARKQQLEESFELLKGTPDVTAEEVATARKANDEALLAEVKRSYAELIRTAQEFGLNTEVLEEERNKRIAEILKDGIQAEKEIYQAFFDDIDTKYRKLLSDTEERVNTLRERILNATNLSPVQQTVALQGIEQIDKVIQATNNLRNAQEKYRAAQTEGDIVLRNSIRTVVDYSQSQVDLSGNMTKVVTSSVNISRATKEQVDAMHAAVVRSKQDLKDAVDALNTNLRNFGSIQGLVQAGIGNLFKNTFKVNADDTFKEVQEKQRNQALLGETIASAFTTAQQAMQTYFDNELAAIERNKTAMQERVDIETQQLKNRAQSQAEEDALDREAVAKKKQLDKEAGEQSKKVKLAEAKIAFATELANIAVAAAQNPLNGITLGAAGIAMYALLAGFAYARYALNVSAIQNAQFEYGGQMDNETTRGGRVKGLPHSRGGNKFLFKGRIFEDEVDEINVIRTKNAPRGKRYSISGTQEQIASALNVIGGGVMFSPGADIRKLELGGVLTSLDTSSIAFTLQAPNPAVLQGRQNDNNLKLEQNILTVTNNLNTLSKQVQAINNGLQSVSQQTNTRIDKLKVQVVAREVTKADSNDKKASSVGRL